MDAQQPNGDDLTIGGVLNINGGAGLMGNLYVGGTLNVNDIQSGGSASISDTRSGTSINVGDTIRQLLDRVTELEKQNADLNARLTSIETQIEFAPDGSGAEEAQQHFNECAKAQEKQ